MWYFPWPSRKKVYKSYKNFDLKHFNIPLKSELEKLNNSAYSEFETAFCSVLNKDAPIKVKMLRHNNNSFMTKITEKQSCTDLNLKPNEITMQSLKENKATVF